MNERLLFHLAVFLDGPEIALGEQTILALEHLGCLFVTLELPVEPCEGNPCKLAAMRLTVGSTVPNGEVGYAGRNMLD